MGWPRASRDTRRVGFVGFEVGGGGVEEQQVDLVIEQRGDLPEHLFLQIRGDVDEPVHRPVAGVVGGLGQAVDVGAARDPAGRGQLRARRQRPVRDQREQHPLGA
jgi:hypothetical protein